jgi:hypothetical protein
LASSKRAKSKLRDLAEIHNITASRSLVPNVLLSDGSYAHECWSSLEWIFYDPLRRLFKSLGASCKDYMDFGISQIVRE